METCHNCKKDFEKSKIKSIRFTKLCNDCYKTLLTKTVNIDKDNFEKHKNEKPLDKFYCHICHCFLKVDFDINFSKQRLYPTGKNWDRHILTVKHHTNLTKHLDNLKNHEEEISE